MRACNNTTRRRTGTNHLIYLKCAKWTKWKKHHQKKKRTTMRWTNSIWTQNLFFLLTMHAHIVNTLYIHTLDAYERTVTINHIYEVAKVKYLDSVRRKKKNCSLAHISIWMVPLISCHLRGICASCCKEAATRNLKQYLLRNETEISRQIKCTHFEFIERHLLYITYIPVCCCAPFNLAAMV